MENDRPTIKLHTGYIQQWSKISKEMAEKMYKGIDLYSTLSPFRTHEVCHCTDDHRGSQTDMTYGDYKQYQHEAWCDIRSVM